jgi:glycosyltransferase involved in cell wall biosynthesis
MKVIFITTESLIDHSFTMAEELKKHLDLKVIITARALSPEIEEFCKKLDAVFVKRLRFINPLAFFKELKLMLFIRQQKADVVWFNAFSLYQSMLAGLFLKRIVVNAHDIDLHPEESDYHGIFSQKITFSFYKRSVAVMSQTQQEIFEKKYGFQPFLLQLPVINYYEASAAEKKPQSAPAYPVKFFFFGTVLPYKGINRLIEAAEILEKKNLHFQISIHGRFKYNKDEFLQRINKLKSIDVNDKFIDYKDVFNIYRTNDVIIIPYIHVSQCGPLLIGFNSSVPAICSDLPGFREYADDGKSALLFENTADDLAGKMETIINDPSILIQMQEYIKKNTFVKFSMQALVKDYINVFKEAF